MSNNNDPDTSGADSLGRAANRYVTFQIVSAIIGGIIFLVILFAFFLPTFQHVNQGISSAQQNMPPMPGGPGTSTLTIDGHPATPEEQKLFNQQFNNPQPPGSAPK